MQRAWLEDGAEDDRGAGGSSEDRQFSELSSGMHAAMT